jgi:hypothetical protein
MLLWLIVWLVSGTPPLHEWNGWLISLIVCAVFDLGGSGRKLA